MDAAKGTEYEEHGCISTASVDRAWGIGDGNSPSGASSRVNGIVTGTIVGDVFEAGWKDFDNLSVDAPSDLKEIVR